MKRDLLIGGAGLVAGLVLALILAPGGKGFNDGKVAGCQILADALSGGLIQCENVKGKLHGYLMTDPSNKQNLEDVK